MCRVSRKVGLLKRWVRSHVGQRRNQKLRAAVAKSQILKCKCTKHVSFGALFQIPIARGCGEKHIHKSKSKKLRVWAHFWKVGCGKIARRCGAKHMCKSKCANHLIFGALFEVQMSKNLSVSNYSGPCSTDNVVTPPSPPHKQAKLPGLES